MNRVGSSCWTMPASRGLTIRRPSNWSAASRPSTRSWPAPPVQTSTAGSTLLMTNSRRFLRRRVRESSGGGARRYRRLQLIYLRRANNDSRVAGWRQYRTGRRVLISFQTRAEVLAGARSAQWGIGGWPKRSRFLTGRPRSVLITKWWTRMQRSPPSATGSAMGLQAREHTGDRWVAACAIAKRLDLLAGDAIYQGAPNLVLHS